jgi:GMP synthase (glutamine-hydrolysing)
VQLHPEVDHAIVAPWVTDDERTALADRGHDVDGLLSDIEAARAELDEAWQPVAEGFARLVHQHRHRHAAR